LAKATENDADLAQSFREWREARRGKLARKFLGGTGPPAQRQ
jgi:hypothetical protein